MINIHTLKLVIWDLDETFWRGTLNEGEVFPIQENIDLVRTLSRHGIINTICSKNDPSVVSPILKELGMDSWFVFPSIDWSPKGDRVAHQIKIMRLRPENCLFIDDNPSNLAEASFYAHGLQLSTPSVISEIRSLLDAIPASDPSLKRLKQYKVMEKRRDAEMSNSDNIAFLFDSNIRVGIKEDCISHLERIHELIVRTNQLNFTKIRSSKEDLEKLFASHEYHCGYVETNDKFGDYGIVGFFAVHGTKLIHFLFSCRVLGLGVEQYIYASLGYPELTIVGETAGTVNDGPAPAWINKSPSDDAVSMAKKANRVVFKGNCELKQLSCYLDTTTITEEFAYINKEGKNIEFTIHSTNYLSFPFLSSEQKDLILRDCQFADEGMFSTEMYAPEVSLILLSTMPEANLGVYRHRSEGVRIAFGEYLFPLTDPNNWNGYISGQIFTSGNHFTREWLEKFCKNWEYLGPLSPQEIEANAKLVLERISPKAKICYVLGSEMPFLNNKQPNYHNRHIIHREINDRLRALSMDNKRVLLVDVNDYLRSQNDFTNNINHFKRRIYYEMACKVNSYIEQLTDQTLMSENRFSFWRKSLVDSIARSGFFQSPLYLWMRPLLKGKKHVR